MPGVAAVLEGRVVSLMAFEIEGDRIIGLRRAGGSRSGSRELGVERMLTAES